jgi:hypothetical protein
MLALVLALLLVPAANTWTVDDDGPADFSQITEAIDQVAPGDVLLVEPGEYEPIHLDKPLTILGRAGGAHPRVRELSRIIAQTFTLAGLDFDSLRVNGVADRGRIDDCSIGVGGDYGSQCAFAVDGCAQLVVSRTMVRGSQDYSESHLFPGGAAMQVRASNVTLDDCDLKGAKGYSGGGSGGYGGTALTVSEASRAVVVASSIVGGAEGLSSNCFMYVDGPSGTGLAVSQSSVVVRGAAGYGSVIWSGSVDGICMDNELPGIDVAQGTVVISGTKFDSSNVALTNASLLEPASPEPLVVITGTDDPGGQRDIRIHGPSGAACVLAVSLVPAYAPLAGFDDKLWVGLSGNVLFVPLVTQGQDLPVVLSWTVPESTAAFVGVSVELQPFFPGLPSTLEPGKSIAGNVAELIVRF